MISKRLTEVRTNLGITQTELAKRLSVTRQAYNHYETGKREPDYETLQKIADFFDVSVDYLLGRTDDKKNTPAISEDSERTRELSELLKALPEDDYSMLISLARQMKLKEDERKRLTGLGD